MRGGELVDERAGLGLLDQVQCSRPVEVEHRRKHGAFAHLELLGMPGHPVLVSAQTTPCLVLDGERCAELALRARVIAQVQQRLAPDGVVAVADRLVGTGRWLVGVNQVKSLLRLTPLEMDHGQVDRDPRDCLGVFTLSEIQRRLKVPGRAVQVSGELQHGSREIVHSGAELLGDDRTQELFGDRERVVEPASIAQDGPVAERHRG